MYSTPPPLRKKPFFFWGKGGWGRLITGYCNHNRRRNWWYIVLEWTTFGEQNNPHPSPLPSIQSWGVCCFLQIARTAAQHCMEEIGERNLYFLFFKLAKRQKGSWGRSVSTNFVADCSYTINLPQHAQVKPYWFLIHFKRYSKHQSKIKQFSDIQSTPFIANNLRTSRYCG